MTFVELLGEIRAILAAVAGVDPVRVTPEKSLAIDLGIDSLTMVKLVVAVEDRFGVILPDEECAHFTSVGDLLTHLERIGASEAVNLNETPVRGIY